MSTITFVCVIMVVLISVNCAPVSDPSKEYKVLNRTKRNPEYAKSIEEFFKDRSVCKFSVTEESIDNVKYFKVQCLMKEVGKCEQLMTSLELPDGETLKVPSACVHVEKPPSGTLANSEPEISNST